MAETPILEVRGLVVDYPIGERATRAVDGVDLQVAPGEFLAIVGESGCGKSTLLFAVAQLLTPPAEVVAGSVRFGDRELVGLSEGELRRLRWVEYSVVLQSAMNALNPVLTIGAQIEDVIGAHGGLPGERWRDRAAAVMRLVGIDPAHLRSYPHQLSGGMRQRAMIAMALVFTPKLVIMDEPTSALDVVAQQSLMSEIRALQRHLGFAVVFVTHDMALVGQVADRLAVMYAGQIVELGPTRSLFSDPKHPYTAGLLQAYPSLQGPRAQLQGIPGSPPDLRSTPRGCRFEPRCPRAMAVCGEVVPGVYAGVGGREIVRCHLYEPEAAAAS